MNGFDPSAHPRGGNPYNTGQFSQVVRPDQGTAALSNGYVPQRDTVIVDGPVLGRVVRTPAGQTVALSGPLAHPVWQDVRCSATGPGGLRTVADVRAYQAARDTALKRCARDRQPNDGPAGDPKIATQVQATCDSLFERSMVEGTFDSQGLADYTRSLCAAHPRWLDMSPQDQDATVDEIAGRAFLVDQVRPPLSPQTAARPVTQRQLAKQRQPARRPARRNPSGTGLKVVGGIAIAIGAGLAGIARLIRSLWS